MIVVRAWRKMESQKDAWRAIVRVNAIQRRGYTAHRFHSHRVRTSRAKRRECDASSAETASLTWTQRRLGVISGNDTAFVCHAYLFQMESRLCRRRIDRRVQDPLTGCKIHRFLLEFQATVVKLAQLLEHAHHMARPVPQQLWEMLKTR